MGQSHSNQPYTIQNTFAHVDERYIDDSGACCLYKVKVKPAPVTNDPDWKEHMIQQLAQLQLEEWPFLLKTLLTNYHNPLTDTNFRITVVESRLIRPRGEISLEGPSGAYGRGSESQMHVSKRSAHPFGVSESRLGGKKSERDVNVSIMKLLETSDILDDRLCPSAYKELLDSFKIERQKTSSNGNPNLSKFSGDLSVIARPVEANVSNATFSAVRRANFQTYQNNTLISQLGPIYKIQSQNITEMNAERTEGCLMYYKQITGIIESQLRQEKNIFRQLMTSFEAYFVKAYQGKIVQLTDSFLNEMNVTGVVLKAKQDLQQFVRIICDGINLFYDMQNLQRGKLSTGESIFSYDNISNFMTTLIFNERIYSIIFQLYEIENSSAESAYRKKLDLMENFRPQDFGVPDEYCLNERTVEYLKRKEPVHTEQGDILGGNDLVCLDRQDPLENTRPFEKAIDCFKGLGRQRSPVHKCKVMIKTVEMIAVCIDEFYDELGVKTDRNLGGDVTLSIFCYLIAKSGMKSILSQCRIVNEFSTTNVMSSICGYYAITLEACVHYICGLPVKEERLIE